MGDPAQGRVPRYFTTSGHVALGLVDSPSPAASEGFDSLFALIAWQLWKEPNARTFCGVALQPSMALRLIQLEGENWIAAGAKNLGCLCLVSLSLLPHAWL